MKNFISISFILCLISCNQENASGIYLGTTLTVHQSFKENRVFIRIVENSLQGDVNSIEKLPDIWCGGASGCYDLGYVITQIIDELTEGVFIEKMMQMDYSQATKFNVFIRVGLEYGNYPTDMKYEDKYPHLYKYLNQE